MNPQTMLQMALDQMPAHTTFVGKAKQYVDGERPELFSSTTLARLLKDSSGRFRTNYARVPVTALTNRVKISSLNCDDKAALAWLMEQWKRNHMTNLSKETHFNAASLGSAYLIAWPNTDEDGNITSLDISPVSTETMRVFYSPENPRIALFAAQVWTEGKTMRVNIYTAEAIFKYVSRRGANGKNAAAFDAYIEFYEETETDDGLLVSSPLWPIPNPFERIPVFHFRPNGTMRPVNKDAWEPQDALNKLNSTMMATIDYTGFPQRYALEHPDANVEDEDGGWDVNTGAVTDEEDQPETPLKSGPAGLWFLNVKEVGQFDAADSDAFLKPIGQYIKAISTTTETPLHAFHGMGDAPSGESLRAANAPLNDNVRDVEDWFEPTWEDLLGFILDVGGFDASASLVWANPEKADDADWWETASLKMNVGVPKAQVLEEAGYDPETIAEWLQDETTEAIDGADPVSLSDKFNALGQAIRAGVDPADAAKQVGLPGLKFTGAVPTTLRPLASDASSLEDK